MLLSDEISGMRLNPGTPKYRCSDCFPTLLTQQQRSDNLSPALSNSENSETKVRKPESNSGHITYELCNIWYKSWPVQYLFYRAVAQIELCKTCITICHIR